MGRVTSAWSRIGGYVTCVAAPLSRRILLIVAGALSTGLLWAIAVTPTVVAFALTVGLAAAWCAWLEKHPEAPPAVAAGPAAAALEVGSPPTRAVHVLAITDAGTRAALAVAKRLTSGNGAQVVLVVPRLTSFATPFDPAGSERTALIDGYRTLAAEMGVHVTVLFCVCHRLDDVARQLLGRSGLVIVGGQRRVWWPSREQRLVDRLIVEGYPVVFAATGARPAGASMPRGRS